MKKFNELSDWIMVGHCATRIKIDGDINNVDDRVAFIEKTPRVRVSRFDYGVEQKDGFVTSQSQDAWIYGPKGSCNYGEDTKSREWCDKMLELLGWY